MTVIASSTTSIVHEVRLVHASTGAVIDAVSIRPTPWPAGWFARVSGGTVLVASASRAGDPAPAFVDITVTDPVFASRLDFPPGAPAAYTVRVALAAARIEVELRPTPMVLTVVLSDQGSGDPSVGKSVTVRPSAGADVPLSPVAGSPGTYSSDPRVWGAPFTPADLRIGSTTVRKVSLDFTRAETRIHVVDPT